MNQDVHCTYSEEMLIYVNHTDDICQFAVGSFSVILGCTPRKVYGNNLLNSRKRCRLLRSLSVIEDFESGEVLTTNSFYTLQPLQKSPKEWSCFKNRKNKKKCLQIKIEFVSRRSNHRTRIVHTNHCLLFVFLQRLQKKFKLIIFAHQLVIT